MPLPLVASKIINAWIVIDFPCYCVKCCCPFQFSSARYGLVYASLCFSLLFSLAFFLFFIRRVNNSLTCPQGIRRLLCDRPIEFINPLCAASKLAARYAQQKNEGKVEAQKSYSWLFSGRGKWSSCTHTHTVAGKMRLNLAWKLTRHLWHNDNNNNKKKLAGKLKRAKAQQQRKKRSCQRSCWLVLWKFVGLEGLLPVKGSRIRIAAALRNYLGIIRVKWAGTFLLPPSSLFLFNL